MTIFDNFVPKVPFKLSNGHIHYIAVVVNAKIHNQSNYYENYKKKLSSFTLISVKIPILGQKYSLETEFRNKNAFLSFTGVSK